MSKVWRVAARCLSLVLVAYFVWFAFRATDVSALRRVHFSARVTLGVFAAALLYAAIIPITAWAWRRLLETQGEHWLVSSLARFLGLSQLAKYIPGNVAQHATRATLAMRAGMGGRAFFVSVGQETVIAVAASLLVGFGVLQFSESAAGLGQLSPWGVRCLLFLSMALAFGVLLMASRKLTPDHLSQHSSRWLRLLGRMGGLPGPASVLAALMAYASNYLMIGAGLWLVARAIAAPAAMDFSLLTAAFALSWALGFLAPGAPAGLGAREASMLLLLHGSASADTLLVFVLLARIVTMLGDGLCFGVASLWHPSDSSPRGDPS